MKTNEAFSIPLPHRALDTLLALEAECGKNPFVFARRPQRPLSNMALAMLLRRMNIDVPRTASERVSGRGARMWRMPSSRSRSSACSIASALRCRGHTIAPACWSAGVR
jgi:hypothetical protein